MSQGKEPKPGSKDSRKVDPNGTSDDDSTSNSNSITSGERISNGQGHIKESTREDDISSAESVSAAEVAIHGDDSKTGSNSDDADKDGSTQPDTEAPLTPERNEDDGDADSSPSGEFHNQNNIAATNPMLKLAGEKSF